MKIIELMTQKPCVLNENASLLEAIRMMEKENCGILPIGSVDHIQGVLTDRDIIIRAIAKQMDSNATKVSAIMTNDVVFCQDDDPVQDAIGQMMRRDKRRILIKDSQGKLVGILSLGVCRT
jgi:CBS domain-containing protein